MFANDFSVLPARFEWPSHCTLSMRRTYNMFKISIIDTRFSRRLVVEGKLVAPWVAELVKTWRVANQALGHRKVVIDLSNMTVVSREGEDAILELMKEGAKFSCGGVLTKHVLGRLARDCRRALKCVAKPNEVHE